MAKSQVIEREEINLRIEDSVSEELRFWQEFNQFTRSKLGRPYLEGKLYEELKRGIIEFLGSPEGCWLDAGCGNLPASKWILEKAQGNVQIWAGDIDVNGANEEIRQIKDARLITIVNTDLTEEWPFPNDFFDGIVGNHVFTFLTRAQKTAEKANGVLKEALQEAYRVLKPGGILIWTMPNKNASTLRGLLHVLKYLLDPSRWRKYGHSLLLTYLKTMRYTRKIERKNKKGIYTLLEKEECERILRSIGFTDLEWKDVFAKQSWLSRAKKPAC
ncbi:MAG: class I SAM-dependent methyltransferase [Chloroflexi bacterium]|nr:class I SAM-dependent methyltransferase [Chloroflexota bacterium]